MAETRISSTELARSVGEIIGRLRFGGESFVIEKNGRPVALLSPYPHAGERGLVGALQAWVEGGPKDPELADLLDGVGKDGGVENPWE